MLGYGETILITRSNMMAKTNRMSVSKLLSLALRHQPTALGLTLDGEGYAGVDGVLEALALRGVLLSKDELAELVVSNDKQRFAFSADGTKIRASQGHSIDVDLGYTARRPPSALFHGTAIRFAASIQRQGLLKGQRQHVHLSTTLATAREVGARHGTPIVFEVAAERMASDGFPFYLSANGVWLTGHVPPSYLRVFP